MAAEAQRRRHAEEAEELAAPAQPLEAPRDAELAQRELGNKKFAAGDPEFPEYAQTAVTRALPAHIKATQLERELEQLPAIVDVSVSRAKRRGVLNGFVYAITFHEVNYNHTASLTLDTNPKSWTRRAEQWRRRGGASGGGGAIGGGGTSA